jgi:hypothetical protein
VCNSGKLSPSPVPLPSKEGVLKTLSPGGGGQGEGVFPSTMTSIREFSLRRRHVWEPMHFRATVFILTAVLVCLTHFTLAAPIQQIQGVIVELEEGFLWLKPDGEAAPRKFLLRWKARFNPPKLPLKGDRVQILYKDKEEGSVIYGVDYLTTVSEPDQTPKDQVPGKGE